MVWNLAYKQKLIDRNTSRREKLDDDMENVIRGREMPEDDQVNLGGGRQLNLAIMFLDICHFTHYPSSNFEEQKNVLILLNLFITEMISIVRDYGGQFEKNTGDGIMAYFGADRTTEVQKVNDAIEAAMTMHYFNNKILTPSKMYGDLLPVRFRIGIDYGPVTICNIGIKNNNSLTAIGSTANIACRLLEFGEEGQIIIGDDVKKYLSPRRQSYCWVLDKDSGFIRIVNNEKYPIYSYLGSWIDPIY